MQCLLKAVLEMDSELCVVGTAADPLEARSMIKELNPDVITLDIEMPNMNGLEFLEKLMRLRPMPVVMVSSLTQKGARASIEALSLGAFECLPKPTVGNEDVLNEIRETVKLAAKSSNAIKYNAEVTSPTRQPAARPRRNGSSPDLVLLGASTGGVEALQTVLSEFPQDCPPTVIVQHMPGQFSQTFTDRLDRLSKPKVVTAEHGQMLEKGTVYVAPGSVGHTTVSILSNQMRLKVRSGEPISGHMPSVDALFDSAVRSEGKKISAGLLTGMGKDGADGLLKLKQIGCHTIAQDEQTSIVFGMPAAAIKNGAADSVLPISKIADSLLG